MLIRIRVRVRVSARVAVRVLVRVLVRVGRAEEDTAGWDPPLVLSPPLIRDGILPSSCRLP